MLTIVHGSDVHFGVPHLPEVLGVFDAAVRAHDPDVLVISGDLTQRAKTHEFEAAAGWLKSFGDLPVVTTPGNHDVPLYRVFERLFTPYRNWTRWISDELDSITRVRGMTVVALNSAAPRTAIVNGRISQSQLAYAREAFRAAPDGDARVLVTHHHMVPAPDYEADRPLPGAPRLLAAFEDMGVDLVLGGHLHRAYIGNSIDHAPREVARDGLITVQSGTTSSNRGRARERLKNSYNVIRIGSDRIEVVHHLYDSKERAFHPTSVHRFPRRPARTVPLEGFVDTASLEFTK